MNCLELFSKAKRLMAEQKPKFWELIAELENVEIEEKVLGAVEKNVHIEEKLFLSKGSVLKAGTRIEGNAYIGENCIIGPNAYLRGNVLIADNCRVANSEIKNSIILSHTNVPHFSYVGDSIIGERVNLGAGAKIANLRFDNNNVKVDFFGTKIDSGRRKLGALIKSDTKIGINACINCGVIIGKNCFVFPGVFVRRSVKDNSCVER
jgi:bifunctional UDP-N-acetylglucosamine pyrophosphorylase/glucosamine-1-phosphate N-acetyltransferase